MGSLESLIIGCLGTNMKVMWSFRVLSREFALNHWVFIFEFKFIAIQLDIVYT